MHALLFGLLLIQTPSLDQYLAAQKTLSGPKSQDQVVALATMLLENGQTERAVGLLEPFVKANPKAVRGRLLLALGYVRQEQYDHARALAGQVAIEAPKDYYAQHVLALSLSGLNRFDEAESRFKRAIELKPDFPDSNFQLGLLYAVKGESLEQARASFQRALDLGYQQAEAYKSLGSVNIKLGRYSEAVEQLKASVNSNPDYTEAYFLLADALRKSGAGEEAAETMKRFQALNEAALDRRSRQAKSQSLYEEGMRLLFGRNHEFLAGNFVKAYEAFAQAASVLPQLDAAWYRMAQIDHLRNDNARALPNIRRAVELNPFESEYYFVLSSCLKDRDLRAAIDAATTSVSLSPGVADFHNLRGILLEKAGDWAQAVESYRRATELEPNEAAFRANLSAALQRLPKKNPNDR